MSEYIGIAVAFVLAGVITAAMVLLASTLGKKKPSAVKSEPFECGEEPVLSARREVGDQVLSDRDPVHPVRRGARVPLPLGRDLPAAGI